MTFKELQATLGETLNQKEWTPFTNRDGTPGGWVGEGATVDPTVQMDPTAIVRGAGTEIGEFVILGPDVQVEGGALIYDGPVLAQDVRINGPVTISGRKTEIFGPDTKVWWNAAPESRADEKPAQLIDVILHKGAHVSGRVALMQTEVEESLVSGPHGKDGARPQGIGSRLLAGSALQDGALAVNSDLTCSTASGLGTQVIESSLTNTVAPSGQRLEGQTLGEAPAPTAHLALLPMLQDLLEEKGEREEEELPPRRHRGHRPGLHTGFRRCENRPTRHAHGEGLGRA